MSDVFVNEFEMLRFIIVNLPMLHLIGTDLQNKTIEYGVCEAYNSPHLYDIRKKCQIVG